jgi:hypothetical protein
MTLTGTDRIEEGVQEARATLAGGEAVGDKLAVGYALQTLMRDRFYSRDFTGALEYIDRAEALATAQQALALGERVGTPRLAEIRSTLLPYISTPVSGTTPSPSLRWRFRSVTSPGVNP